MEDNQPFSLYEQSSAENRPPVIRDYSPREYYSRTPWIPQMADNAQGQGSTDGQYSIMGEIPLGRGQPGACDAYGASLVDHKPAMQVLAKLPLDTVIKLFRHQWHKDTSRIIFAHSEQYIRDIDFACVSASPRCHPRRGRLQAHQLKLLRRDLDWHRNKYISYYLDAVISSSRWQKVGSSASPTLLASDQVTKDKADGIRKALTVALRTDTPADLARVFYGEVPHGMEGVFDRAEIDNIITRPGSLGAQVHPLLFCIPITVVLISTSQPSLEIIPKNPDHHWCWNQPTAYIKAKHEDFQLDMF